MTVKLELPERGGGTTVTTDKKGRWAVGGIAAGTWHIDSELPGHASRRVSVSLPSESSRLAPLEVKLERAATADVSLEARQALDRAEGAYKEGRFAEARAEYATLLALRPDLAPRIHQQIGFSWIQLARKALRQLP